MCLALWAACSASWAASPLCCTPPKSSPSPPCCKSGGLRCSQACIPHKLPCRYLHKYLPVSAMGSMAVILSPSRLPSGIEARMQLEGHRSRQLPDSGLSEKSISTVPEMMLWQAASKFWIYADSVA